MKSLIKYILIVFVILVVISGLVAMFQSPFANQTEEISLSKLVAQINAGEVKEIVVRGDQLDILLTNDNKETSKKEVGVALGESLINLGVDRNKLAQVSVDIKSESGALYYISNFLPLILPFIFVLIIFWFMFRQAQRGAMTAFNFGKSKARLANEENGKKKTTFKDVAGLVEAKEEVAEVVEFLRDPRKFQKLGARMPRGVLLVGSPGTGKCITGDTTILTNKGLIEIAEIPKYFFVNKNDGKVFGTEVCSIENKSLKPLSALASNWYNLGLQKTIKIITRIGLRLEGTEEHPIVIIDKDTGDFVFRRLDQIKNGDIAVVNYNQQVFGDYKRIPTQQTAYVLGLLCGDGGLSIKDRIYFTNADPNLVKVTNNYFKQNFGKGFTKVLAAKYDYLISDQSIKETLRNWGIEDTYARGKKIPDTILLGPKEYITSFLRGLFDTDGYCGKEEVELSSASKKLAGQTSMLLWNLGIINRMHNRIKRYNGQEQYYLSITGTGLDAFSREIGFTVPHKKNQLEILLSKHRNPNVDLVFFQQKRLENLWQYFKTEVGELNRKFYANPLYRQLFAYIKYEKNPSKKSLDRILELFASKVNKISRLPEYRFLQELGDTRFFLTPIVKIEKGENIVYDFTVPKIHSFTGNFFINHNTLLAKAVANEANVPFYYVSGSEFVEMFVGVGANRVRDTFETAKKTAPSIIFIDEIDAIGRHRGAGLGGGHDEREQTLNQILVEMDGFGTNDAVVIFSATNRPDILDPALLRPGRFDRRIILDEPSINDREAILKIHAADKPLAKGVNLRVAAERTPGFSGADLANLLNEAAILAARKNQKEIIQDNLFQAIEKVILGPERRSHIFSKKEKKITAYHEAGHALVAISVPYTDPVHKVSIVSRGRAGGYTLKLPTEDKHLKSRSEFESELAVLLGGYTAERITFNELTPGASNDLKVASELARKMVTQYGMSDKLGPITFGEKGELVFLGKELTTEKNYSEETAQLIDAEVKRFITGAFKKAREVLTKKMDVLEKIAKELITKETLEQKEFYALVRG